MELITKQKNKNACAALTQEEEIDLCEKFIAENKELIAINYILCLVMGISDVVVGTR